MLASGDGHKIFSLYFKIFIFDHRRKAMINGQCKLLHLKCLGLRQTDAHVGKAARLALTLAGDGHAPNPRSLCRFEA